LKPSLRSFLPSSRLPKLSLLALNSAVALP
jgi:hypothetical protein